MSKFWNRILRNEEQVTLENNKIMRDMVENSARVLRTMVENEDQMLLENNRMVRELMKSIGDFFRSIRQRIMNRFKKDESKKENS